MIKRLGLIALLAAATLTACGKAEVRPTSSGDPTTTTTTTAVPLATTTTAG